jgi:hypothetical protein
LSAAINFPQVPFVDSTGNVDIQWKMWLMNPQYLTINLAIALAVGSGGTGIGSGTPGGILGFIGPTVIGSSTSLNAGELIIGGGPGSLPSTPIGRGTVPTVLHGNASGNPSFGPVLSSEVVGLDTAISAYLATAFSAGVSNFLTTPNSATFNTALTDHALAMTGGLGVNGKAAQSAYASGGAAPSGGTGTSAGGWDTAAHRDAAITLLNNIRSALVANGIMS